MAETTAWPTWAWPTPQTLAKDFSTMSTFIMARWDDDHEYGGEGDDDDHDYFDGGDDDDALLWP